MKAIGAKYFDPMPPDQWQHPLQDPDARPIERFMALVYASTIAHGKRSPFCCDETGKPRTLDWFQETLGWTMDWTHKVANSAVQKGLIELKNRRVLLRGKVLPTPLESTAEGEERAKTADCTLRELVPDYMLETVLAWDLEAREALAAELADEQQRFKAEQTAVVAYVRERSTVRLDSLYRKRGLEWKRPERKPAERKLAVAQLAFEMVDQATPENRTVHSENSSVYTPPIRTVQADASFYGFSENFQKGVASSSSSLPSEEGAKAEPGPPETTTALGLSRGGRALNVSKVKTNLIKENEFRSLLQTLCEEAGITGTPNKAQAHQVYVKLPENGRRAWLDEARAKATGNHPSVTWRNVGVLLADAQAFRDAWPAKAQKIHAKEAAAAATARAEEVKLKHAELKSAYYTYLDHREDLAVVNATESDFAAARARAKNAIPHWAQLTREQREAHTLTYLRADKRAELMSFDEWKSERGKKGAGA